MLFFLLLFTGYLFASPNPNGPFPTQDIVIGSNRFLEKIPTNMGPNELCKDVECPEGQDCQVRIVNGSPAGHCEACPNGTVYESCPGCEQLRSCANRFGPITCLNNCLPLCVCPEGQMRHPCGNCVSMDECPPKILPVKCS